MFCSNCGTNAGDANFCPGCGNKLGQAAAPVQAQAAPALESQEEAILWEGKPAGIVDKAKGGLNSVSYRLTNQRLIISGGLIGKKQTEVELYRVKDIKVSQTLTEKISGVGDVTIVSADAMDGKIVLDNVKDPMGVKEMIRTAVSQARRENGVVHREAV